MKYSSRRIIDILGKIKVLSHKNPAQEICGLVGKRDGKYFVEKAKNISTDTKSFFCIDPVQYLLFKNDFSLIMCFHSHILGDESFSEFDVKMSENCCIPFLVYSLNTKKFNIYSPKTSESDVSIVERFKEKI
jgi:proteasome lid subunit RPN8/RPN11